MRNRTFVCTACNNPWSTDKPGRFTLCPSCKEQRTAKDLEEVENGRTKVCGYRLCSKVFQDTSAQNSLTYCCVQHRDREKQFRSGKAKDASYFRENKVKVGRSCTVCHQPWHPTEEDRAVRCPSCRKKARNKVCVVCNELFIDDSRKNTQKAHPTCRAQEQKTVNVVSDALTLEISRHHYDLSGTHGRMDSLDTLTKGTNTWFGRVAEKIFQAYMPSAKDYVTLQGVKSPSDFETSGFGNVGVRSAKATFTKHGQKSWKFQLARMPKCSYVFLVGYNEERSNLEKIWMVPKAALPEQLSCFTPTSAEYMWAPYDVSNAWGLDVGNKVIKECYDLPDPEEKDKYAWMDDPSNLEERLPGHRGRRGELLYKVLYPDSVDQNRIFGSTSPYDFLDADGTKVNVKISSFIKRSDSEFGRWGFARGRNKTFDQSACDLYSCLCLSEEGILIAEYRIPREVLAGRRAFNISEVSKWDTYKVPLKKEGLFLGMSWGRKPGKRVRVALSLLDPQSPSYARDIVGTLLGTIPPVRQHTEDGLYHDFMSLQTFSGQIVDGVVLAPSTCGSIICDQFFPYRLEGSYRGYPNALDGWTDPVWLLKAVEFQIRHKLRINPKYIFRTMLAQLRTPTNFRPPVAKTLIDTYCPKEGIVFDPCAGYGGRLVATLASGRKYCGVDPHPKAKEAFEKLPAFLKMSASSSFLSSPIEDVDLTGIQADMALTSPPYFSIEKYSVDALQSYKRYPMWEQWVRGFLRPMFQKTFQVLKPGAVFCLNVGDILDRKLTFPLIETSKTLAKECGFHLQEVLQIPMGKFSKKNKSEPVLVLVKPLAISSPEILTEPDLDWQAIIDDLPSE